MHIKSICTIHQSNKNYNSGSWNRPHLHNGCFYSVIYIHADGDEGHFRAIDTDFKIVVSIFHIHHDERVLACTDQQLVCCYCFLVH